MSNTMFNNKMFSCATIQNMYPSAEILYKVAFDKGKVKSPASVARAMDVTQQRLKNWETRGVSRAGAMKAQEIFGVDANSLRAADVGYNPLVYQVPVNDTTIRTMLAAERTAKETANEKYDQWTAAAITLMLSLKPNQREGALAALRTHIQNLGPPRDGQTLSMAA